MLTMSTYLRWMDVGDISDKVFNEGEDILEKDYDDKKDIFENVLDEGVDILENVADEHVDISANVFNEVQMVHMLIYLMFLGGCQTTGQVYILSNVEKFC